MNITFINRMMGIKFGGGENFDLNMARALKKRGHNVRFVIGVANSYSEPVNLDNEFEVIRVKTSYLRDIHYKINPSNFLKRLIYSFVFELDNLLFQIFAYLKLKNDCWTDIYQICGRVEIASWISNKGKKTAVRWPGPPSSRKLKWMKKCDVNFANGDAFKIIKEKLLSECKEVNLGIDTQKFYPIEKKYKSIIEFLFVGRIIPIKNLSFLIKSFLEALKENNNIILNIVGNGEEKEINKLKSLTKGNKNINFLGAKNKDELVKIYQNNDVFALTSNYDNYPNVIFEAMASGLPVIGTNVGGIPSQVVNKETGLIIENNNIKQLKDAILDLANDKELREKMGMAGRKRVEKEFSWEKSAKQLEKIYVELLK